MNRSTMPDDVRAKITALFPTAKPSPEQLRAASLAPSPDRPARSAAGLLARVTATDPELGAYARWIVATGGRQGPDTIDRAAAEREIRSTMAALRVVAYRRESALLATYLDEQPNDARARQRVLDLAVAVRDLERRFPGAAQRAQIELARDASAPIRRAPMPARDPDEQETR